MSSTAALHSAGDALLAEPRAQQPASDGSIRVGVAAAVDHVDESLRKALCMQQRPEGVAKRDPHEAGRPQQVQALSVEIGIVASSRRELSGQVSGCGFDCSGFIEYQAERCGSRLELGGDSTCQYACNGGFADCTSAPGCETNIATGDIYNCGACGRACLADGFVDTVRCSAGRCNSTCVSGYGNANMATSGADDGCEADLNTNVANCGVVGRACSTSHVATAATCVGGLCGSPCVTGWFNVAHPAAPTPDDGCEAPDLNVNIDNCGGVGRACSDANVATRRCTSGVCTPTCTSGWANASLPLPPLSDDGCETVDATGCGSVGPSCAGGLSFDPGRGRQRPERVRDHTARPIVPRRRALPVQRVVPWTVGGSVRASRKLLYGRGQLGGRVHRANMWTWAAGRPRPVSYSMDAATWEENEAR
jgi:hypothetical protein